MQIETEDVEGEKRGDKGEEETGRGEGRRERRGKKGKEGRDSVGNQCLT